MPKAYGALMRKIYQKCALYIIVIEGVQITVITAFVISQIPTNDICCCWSPINTWSRALLIDFFSKSRRMHYLYTMFPITIEKDVLYITRKVGHNNAPIPCRL